MQERRLIADRLAPDLTDGVAAILYYALKEYEPASFHERRVARMIQPHLLLFHHFIHSVDIRVLPFLDATFERRGPLYVSDDLTLHLQILTQAHYFDWCEQHAARNEHNFGFRMTALGRQHIHHDILPRFSTDQKHLLEQVGEAAYHNLKI